ncbi:EscU/YscU/HrcU family type III secretion system export apparatus switch protein [Desulfoluna sp.]|uniref:EscU/YscU/HrcU family type III secretion system export apparatus switch protein n=1 Tax=Desulfoluna sp. TaxID=2045199 RepID=UPI0026134FC2|nr:EscU/YscU/HrcU family type III secretion system export apparatus switch protein [Desulfoluna sp.]
MLRSKKGRQTAVALGYNRSEGNAPRVTATGRGPVADKIIALAREHGVPVQCDPDLVEVLAALDLDTEIPEEIYAVVAELLAFVYRTNNKLP